MPIPLSVPSTLIPDTLAANVRVVRSLADKGAPVTDVGLAFFEAESCLAYTEEDLPEWLAETGFSYHVHLPLDPGWAHGADHVAEMSLAMADKAAFLSPWGFVLHPPLAGSGGEPMLRRFAEIWSGAGHDVCDVLLENIESNGLLDGLPCMQPDLLAPALDMGFSVCVDVGHVIAFGQDKVVERLETLAGETGEKRIRLAHVYDPGHAFTPSGPNTHWHLGMRGLTHDGADMTARVLRLLAPDGMVHPEVFTVAELETSLPVLDRIFTDAGLELTTP